MEWNYNSIPLEDPVTLASGQKILPDLTADNHRIAVRKAIEVGDIMSALMQCGYKYLVPFILDNWELLKNNGMYEKALAFALTMPRKYHHHISPGPLRFLLTMAIRATLEAEGDPIPEGESFTLFRGVAGKGVERRLVGISWTSDSDRSKWFTKSSADLENYTVLKAVVPRDAIYFYNNRNKEHEFICIIPQKTKLECVEGLGPTDRSA